MKPFMYISTGHSPDEALRRADIAAKAPHQSIGEQEAKNIIMGLRTAVTELTDRLTKYESVTDGPKENHQALYMELLMQVGNAYPGETRHQTALRYLKNAEAICNVDASSAKQS